MCCSTSAATAPPPSGNRLAAKQPIRATLPPVSIETNRQQYCALTSANFSYSMSLPSNELRRRRAAMLSLTGLEDMVLSLKTVEMLFKCLTKTAQTDHSLKSLCALVLRHERVTCLEWCRALNVIQSRLMLVMILCKKLFELGHTNICKRLVPLGEITVCGFL